MEFSLEGFAHFVCCCQTFSLDKILVRANQKGTTNDSFYSTLPYSANLYIYIYIYANRTHKQSIRSVLWGAKKCTDIQSRWSEQSANWTESCTLQPACSIQGANTIVARSMAGPPKHVRAQHQLLTILTGHCLSIVDCYHCHKNTKS